MGEASALNYKKNMWVGYVEVAIFGKHNLPHYSVNICWLKDCFVLSTSFSTSLLCHLPITWLGNLIVSVGSQKNRINQIYIYIYIEICFKNLTYTIMGAGKSEICRGGWQARNPGNNWCYSLESKIHRAGQQNGNPDKNWCCSLGSEILRQATG